MLRLRVHRGRLFLLSLFAFLLLQRSNAQYPAGARSHALAGASMMVDNGFAISSNPALLGSTKGLVAGISHRQHYLLPTLSTSHIGISWRGNFGGLEGSFSQSGIPEMRRYWIELGYGKRFGKALMSGMGLHYAALSAPAENIQYRSATFSLGFIVSVNEKWSAAIYTYNPIPSQLTPGLKLMQPSVYRAGFICHFNENGFIVAEGEKVSGLPPGLRVAMEYGLQDRVFIRAGIRLKPLEWSFGSGFLLGPITIDIAASLHPALGITPEISVTFNKPWNEN